MRRRKKAEDEGFEIETPWDPDALTEKNCLEKMIAAVHENDVDRVKLIDDAFSIPRELRLQACLEACKGGGAPEALKVLLEKHGFDFSSDGKGDKAGALALYKLAQNNPRLMTVLFEANRTSAYGKLDNGEFLAAETPLEMVGMYIENARPEENDLFNICIEKIGMVSPEKMEFVLSWTAKFSAPQPILDAALVKVAEKGDARLAALLLQRKADVNLEAGKPVLLAAEKGHQAMVELLLSHLDCERHAGDVAIRLKQNKAESPFIPVLEKAAAEAAANKQEKERYSRVDEHTLAEVQNLPGGKKLTTLFNFNARQQKDIVEMKGSIAITVTNFNEIDAAYLEEKRRKLQELGGDAKSLNTIEKPRPAAPSLLQP